MRVRVQAGVVPAQVAVPLTLRVRWERQLVPTYVVAAGTCTQQARASGPLNTQLTVSGLLFLSLNSSTPPAASPQKAPNMQPKAASISSRGAMLSACATLRKQLAQ